MKRQDNPIFVQYNPKMKRNETYEIVCYTKSMYLCAVIKKQKISSDSFYSYS